MADALTERRLLVITGKGGTGKSVVSAALALVAARRGKRVLCCEVTARERIASLFGRPPSGPEVREVAPGIFSVHVQPEAAMREYGLMVLRFRAVYEAVFENRLVRYFLRAVPALQEVVSIGKVGWHAARETDDAGRPAWDLVVLDAPATGHGISLLRTPRDILETVPAGPMHRDMKFVDDLLHDPASTAVCIVTLPEEMPANEAQDLHAALAELALPQGPLFLNAFFPPRFEPAERREISAAAAASGDPLLASAALAAETYSQRAELSALYADRLAAAVPRTQVQIPFVFSREFGEAEVAAVARALEASL